MPRQRVLWLITLVLPLALLAGLEGALRLAGVGRLEPLFIPVATAPGYLQPNPDAVRRFFPDPARAPDVSIDTTWFAARKAPGTLRIFVQGESTAAGFPYGRWASPAALLQQRLQRAYPERDVEVIDTAMAAVTSYVLLDFADEILAQQPDAVVVYTGHNEYLGIGGVGSSLVGSRSPATARAIAALRRLHLYRALETSLAPWLAPAHDPLAEAGTLMSKVARERSIALGSPLFHQGEAQFRGNLTRLLEKYRRAGVPVFVGTLASNLRDQPPFVSVEPGGPGSARARYASARALDAQGRTAEALAAYTAAKDLDGLRFRAPESFDALIREVAGAHGATLVDVRTAFARAARDGIVGADLMLEHVHPNVDGYFVLASAYYPALIAWAGPPAVQVDDATARREWPVTELDRFAGECRALLLRNDWPFVPVRRTDVQLPAAADRIQALAQSWFLGRTSWAEAMREALEEYQRVGNATEAARVAVNLADAFVTSAPAQYTAGRLLLRADQPARAVRYLERAVGLDDATPDYRLSLAESYARTDRPQQSIATLEQVLAVHPDEERAQYWLREMRLREREAAAARKP